MDARVRGVGFAKRRAALSSDSSTVIDAIGDVDEGDKLTRIRGTRVGIIRENVDDVHGSGEVLLYWICLLLA